MWVWCGSRGGGGRARVWVCVSMRGQEWAPQCLTTWGQWAVENLQHSTTLPRGSGQWNSCGTPPLCFGGSGHWNSCHTPRHCLGALGSRTPTTQCHTAWWQLAVELLQFTATPSADSGRWNSYGTLPHCLGVVGSGTLALHRHTAWGQWAVECGRVLAGASCPCTTRNHRPWGRSVLLCQWSLPTGCPRGLLWGSLVGGGGGGHRLPGCGFTGQGHEQRILGSKTG